MLTLSYTFDIAVQELAAVRERHEDAALRHGSLNVRHVHHRRPGHGEINIAVVSPEL